MDYNLPQSLRFRIGSTQFVAGGFWHKAVSNLRAERARNTADLKPAHVITRKNAGQFGICRLEEDDKPRLWEICQSAAGAISDADPTDWIAAYQLGPDHLWVVANRDGVIEFDAVFDDRETAKAEFLNRYTSRTWPKAYAPNNWQIEGTKSQTIDRALEALKGPILLPSFLFKDIPLKRAALPLSAGVLAVALLFQAVTRLPEYVSFDFVFDKPEETAAEERPLTPAVIRPAMPVVVPLPAAANLCVEAIYKLFLRARTLPGWEVGSVNCDGNTVSTSVRATEIASLAAVIDHLPGSQLDIASRMASVSYLLQSLEATELTSTLSEPHQLQVRLAALSDAYQLRFLTDKVEPSLPGGAPQPSTLRWSLKTQAPPMFWEEALKHIPGAALSTIKFDPSTSNWSIGGLAHVS